MIGWPSPVSDAARALLSPEAAKRPQIPRLTGRDDVSAKIKALEPDLIIDYGTVSPRYVETAQTTQQRTGVPTILLDGSMTKIPEVLRTLGGILHREDRAETLARFAEALLALPTPSAHPRVVYARGPVRFSDRCAEYRCRRGIQPPWLGSCRPEGQGTFRPATINAIKQLDPDLLIFSSPPCARGARTLRGLASGARGAGGARFRRSRIAVRLG